MYREIQIRLLPSEAIHEEAVVAALAKQLGVNRARIKHTEILKRSVDARHRPVVLNLSVGVHLDDIEKKEPAFLPAYQDVSDKEPIIIVGAGPAGLFAALRLIEKGLRPIILERGKSIAERKKDLQNLYSSRIVNEDSNFGFGEGGAGTFSDGKLYTRSNKRGNIQRILEILVFHGASEDILTDAHPHIGTDKLPFVIQRIRETIEKYGGNVLFNTRVTDFLIANNQMQGVVAGGKEYRSRAVILATGHSARDIYRILYNKGIDLEPKDFAVGLRLEHQQADIDCMQYHTQSGRGEYLPAAEYNFVTNVDGRGVYTFCMCPGGVVVPAATGKEQQVLNGMSSSARNTQWSNAAIVTTVGQAELYHYNRLKTGQTPPLLGGILFQEELERRAWQEGGGNLVAPAQTLTDFLAGRFSQKLPFSSYKLGLNSSEMDKWLPNFVSKRIQRGIFSFGAKAKQFMTETALLLGVETRTSSPLRIPRVADTKEHIKIQGLFPCGEGAGYSGGIISSAMDGEGCAEVFF
ncbi:NAD-utilizing dehydrogenase [Bacteroidia bacterium]|nr:NAD-utilizing dehydrogenase [Bacteroidia bacterium]